ncbi:MAG: hypothetical protein J7493_13405 [Porphyrobacter sp.]|nr:hypothetical protein [Porphyrobacter sp.]
MSQAPAIGPMIFVRQFRLWVAARAKGEHPLPHMQSAVSLFETAPELSVACASLFDMVEAQLERPLQPECCCSPAFSRDERALLGILRHAPEAGQPLTSSAVPHGLPGAICWAAFAVRRAMAETFTDQFGAPDADGSHPAQCPFSQEPEPILVAVA